MPETEPATVETLPTVAETVAETPTPEAHGASPLDLPADVFRAGLDRRKANRGALMEWIRLALVEGTDYGRIHTAGRQKCPLVAQGRAAECRNPQHWSKPSLFKPGAEKICGMLGVTVHYPNLAAYEEAALTGRSIGTIILRCELHDGQGRVVAEGVGARNVQQDYGDLNKSLKMAGKSAHIDATLRMAGLSEVFTQDLEDMKAAEGQQPSDVAMGQDVQEPEPPAVVTEAEVRRLEAAIEDFGLDRERVRAWVQRACKVDQFAELSPVQMAKLMKKLEQWASEDYARAEAAAVEEEA